MQTYADFYESMQTFTKATDNNVYHPTLQAVLDRKEMMPNKAQRL